MSFEHLYIYDQIKENGVAVYIYVKTGLEDRNQEKESELDIVKEVEEETLEIF